MSQPKKQQPGVMFYFDLIPAVKELTQEERADIFLAILEYAKDGTIPDFSSHALKSIFPLIKSRIDNDKQKYTEKCEKNELNAKYKAYRAKRIEAGSDFWDFEEWKEHYYEQAI